MPVGSARTLKRRSIIWRRRSPKRPSFALDRLRQVLPVVVTRELPLHTLTIVSLELYEAGFAAVLLVEQTAEQLVASRGDDIGAPMLTLTVTDDRGQRYLARPRAGSSGGAAGDGYQMRDVYYCEPALDPAAIALTLVVDAVDGLH